MHGKMNYNKNEKDHESIYNIESVQNDQDNERKKIEISNHYLNFLARSIVKKNFTCDGNKNLSVQNQLNLFGNENIVEILSNPNKRKIDDKLERLDFLSSSFQNSFQSKTNKIEMNKIPIHNNKIFNNVFKVRPENNELQNNLHFEINQNNNSDLIVSDSLNFGEIDRIVDLSQYCNRKHSELIEISPNMEISKTNLERELLKKNLGVYENDNIRLLNNCKVNEMNVEKENKLNEKNQNLRNELNKELNTRNSQNENLLKSKESSLDQLKKNLNQLDEEKTSLEREIIEMRKKIKNIKKEDYNKKINLLEKEREDSKKTANNYLQLCSQLAEEVIVLRNQLDKYTHFKKEK